MKKRNLTLFTAFAAAAAFAPTAQAAIIATSELNGWVRTESGTPVNWDVTADVTGRSAGTLDIDGGSTMTMYNTGVSIGGSNPGTMTVTGSGSHYDGSLGGALSIGNNAAALGTLNVEDGGWVETYQTQMGQSGNSVVTVTGAGSKLTASNRLQVGRTGTPSVTLTVADGGLVQTALLQFGEGGESTVGNVHMAVGGILAVFGDKTANPFVNGGLFTFSGTPTSEIQYDAGAGFVNMNGAAVENTDYTIEYVTTSTFINGQDVNGYTVLTLIGGTPPAASTAAITSITWGSPNASITMTGVDSTDYTCESSIDLVDWALDASAPNPINTTSSSATFDVAAGAVKKFYRIAE